jgi:hypothetical protein
MTEQRAKRKNLMSDTLINAQAKTSLCLRYKQVVIGGKCSFDAKISIQ